MMLFWFEHEHEGYKRHADCTVYAVLKSIKLLTRRTIIVPQFKLICKVTQRLFILMRIVLKRRRIG